jgi:tryptophan synthase alpha chain
MEENKIVKVFKDLGKAGRKAFIPYITAGDPDLEKTTEVLGLFADNGADVIELGVPFSDPMADGPVIQKAMERSLKKGTTLRGVLETVKKFRDKHDVPIVLMGYYNPFLAYGIEAFAVDAEAAGVDAVLTVDLPPEEAKTFAGLLRKEGIISVFLATPVSDQKRIQAIKRVARGFVYFVSVTGVTGERSILPDDIKGKIDEIRTGIGLPVVLGFGISGTDIIRRFSPHADGFVVGSALVKRWEEACLSLENQQAFQDFFREMAEACHDTGKIIVKA